MNLLSAAWACLLLPSMGFAQEIDHSKMQMPEEKPAAVEESKQSEPVTPTGSDGQQEMDHSKMQMPEADPAAVAEPKQSVTPIPILTPADRLAAFPPLSAEAVHDNSIQYFMLLDRLEVRDADPGTAYAWEGLGWIGTDLNRLWLRSDGEGTDSRVELGTLEILYGHSFSRWWDVVAGVRHDRGEDPSQTYAAFGVQGLAPYKFDVEATAYVGQGGQTSARLEADYDTLFTNRLILQWQAEVNVYGQDDLRRGIGSGLSNLEAGVRLRYEVTRQFAPYLGVAYERVYGGTATLRRAAGAERDDTRLVAGLRLWF